ncbi:MAG: ParB/RepB/Spo0J family partition protein, partial [Deferrisomatales bacterium]
MDRAGGWRVLRPGDLDRDPGRYCFSWPGPTGAAALAASLGRFGLLRPLLARAGAGRPLLVGGHRRLAALVTLGVAEVPVRVVAGGDGPELWDLLLEEHLDGRPLNPVELGLYALRRGEATGEAPEELAGRVLPRLGLPPRAAALEDPRWIAGLPERHRDAFAEGALPAQGVRVLAQAARDDALAALDLLAPFRLGV